MFISYARPDEPQAKRVADALRSAGYSVWRDDELPLHRPYAGVIQERLIACGVVVVLWSKAAINSDWVRAEADWARNAGTLVQATLDQTSPPLPFNQIQCADLTGWDGRSDAPGWTKLAAGIVVLVGAHEPAAGLRGRRPPRRRLSICVLPFVNMSGEAEQEYFSSGISEDITTDLSKVSALEVVAGNTGSMGNDEPVDVCALAEQLRVSHVLEGSVRKAGSRVRITAQLIDGRTGGHIWADRYDRDLTDIFAIQDEISKAIAGALRLKLLPDEKRAIEQRGTTSADAYNLYLLARQYWISGDFGDRRREERVVRICKRAVETDADYARAWALMGLAQATLCYSYSRNEVVDDGAAAAERALALDADIAEAHLPAAWRLAMAGHTEEAHAEIETALRLGPESWEVNKEAARIVFRLGKLDEATSLLERATRLMETDFHGWGMLSACYLAQGQMEKLQDSAIRVIEQVERVLGRDPDNGTALAFGAFSLAATGDLVRAREWIDRALLLAPDNLYMRYYLAWPLLAFFKNNEAAISMLEPALAKAGHNLISLAMVDWNLDSLRDDLRFKQMLAKAEARVSNPPEQTRNGADELKLVPEPLGTS